MGNRTEYQQAKATAKGHLQSLAEQIKGHPSMRNDKPAMREAINNAADAISRDLPHSLTDQQRERITSALHSLAGRLHP